MVSKLYNRAVDSNLRCSNRSVHAFATRLSPPEVKSPRWMFNPKLEPEVILRVSQLQVSCNMLSLLDVGDHACLYFNIGGVSASTTKVTIIAGKLGRPWTEEEIFLSITTKMLRENRLRLDFFREVDCRDGPKRMLGGSAHLWCPYTQLSADANSRESSNERKACVQTFLRHGSCNYPVSYVEFTMSAEPWFPDSDSLNSQRISPEICLDVFDEDNDQRAGHLGRAVLHGGQIQRLCTIDRMDKRESDFKGTPVCLPLRPRSAREAKFAGIKVRGTISIQLLAARNLDFLQTGVTNLKPQVSPSNAILIIEKSADTKGISDTVRRTLATVITAAWNLMQSGRHLMLHIVDGSGLSAPEREKERERRDARSALLSVRPIIATAEDELSFLPNSFCVVQWHGLEIARTAARAHTRTPSWFASVPIPPTSVQDSNSVRALVLDVQDDSTSFDDQSAADSAFMGRLILSSAQLWELSRITHLRLFGPAEQSLLADIKVDFSLSRRRRQSQNGAGDAEDDEGEDIKEAAPRVILSISDMAAAELPDTTLAARLFGRLSRAKQTPYVVVRLWNIDARSSTIKHAGTSVTWKHERAYTTSVHTEFCYLPMINLRS